MDIPTIRGVSDAVGHDQGERVTVNVFNLVGAEIAAGSPVCFSVTASDGVSVVLPATGTDQSNFTMLAGVAENAIGTAEYGKVVSKGVVSARVYGVASRIVPGSQLALAATRDYLIYGTAGQINGEATYQQRVAFTALETATTANTASRTIHINAV